jgi:small subunit ribosomal protein S1
MTGEKRLNHPREALNLGQTVRAVVLDVDRDKRRIKLGMKQLQPTSLDEYIAEHKTGDVVTGRVVEVHNGRMRVELGEGVIAESQAPAAAAAAEARQPGGKSSDISSLTAMLSAKWKQGGSAASSPAAAETRAGQVRNFRIVTLDPARKTIQLEVAE